MRTKLSVLRLVFDSPGSRRASCVRAIYGPDGTGGDAHLYAAPRVMYPASMPGRMGWSRRRCLRDFMPHPGMGEVANPTYRVSVVDGSQTPRPGRAAGQYGVLPTGRRLHGRTELHVPRGLQ